MSTIPGSTLFVIELATGPLLDPEPLLPGAGAERAAVEAE
jgi:hypothetical protein